MNWTITPHCYEFSHWPSSYHPTHLFLSLYMSCEQDNVAETLCKLMKIVPILPIWTSPWRNRLVRSAVSERLVDQSQPGTVLFALMSKLLLISLIILSDNQYWLQRHVSSTLFFFSLPEIKDLRKKAAIFSDISFPQFASIIAFGRVRRNSLKMKYCVCLL